MPTDPALMLVKPGAVSAEDKTALRDAGVIVVEVEDPSAVRFMRAGYELPTTALLGAAVEAIIKSGGSTVQRFGEGVGAAILAQLKVDRTDDA